MIGSFVKEYHLRERKLTYYGKSKVVREVYKLIDYSLLIIGLALLFVSYLVAIKKQTWLLAGFNEKMIKNKSLLAKVVGGGFFLPLSLLIIINSFIDYPYEVTLLLIIMLILLTIIYLFINRRLLD